MSAANRRLTNPLQNRVSTTQAISAELRTAIVDGRLAPGQALRQETLAQHFNVSHIPIREALRQLESEGWVQIEQNKGATVSPLDAGEAREIYEMRAVLECHLLRLAIPAHDAGSLKAARSKLLTASRERDPNLYVQRNEEFHIALLSPAPRPHTLAEIELLHRRSERYLRLKYLQPNLKHESDREHLALLDACERRDVRGAVKIMSQHLLGTGELLGQHLDDLRKAKPPTRRSARKSQSSR